MLVPYHEAFGSGFDGGLQVLVLLRKGDFAMDTTATPEEQAYLRSGRRVELDEIPAPKFITWVRGGIKEQLSDRLVPGDRVLEDAYRRALVVTRLNRGS